MVTACRRVRRTPRPVEEVPFATRTSRRDCGNTVVEGRPRSELPSGLHTKEQLLGLDAGGLLGRPFQEFMAPAYAAKIPDLFYREGAPCAFAHVVVRYISATGFLLVVEISGVPLFAENGALLGFQGVECDLAALPARTGQEMPALDTIFGLTPIAACVVGRDGRLLAANARHAVLSGRPLMEVIGRHVKDLHRESGEKIVQDFIKLDAGGRIL